MRVIASADARASASVLKRHSGSSSALKGCKRHKRTSDVLRIATKLDATPAQTGATEIGEGSHAGHLADEHALLAAADLIQLWALPEVDAGVLAQHTRPPSVQIWSKTCDKDWIPIKAADTPHLCQYISALWTGTPGAPQRTEKVLLT